MAPPAGFSPATSRFEAGHSNKLSYGGKNEEKCEAEESNLSTNQPAV